jgi:hypothetical protein
MYVLWCVVAMQFFPVWPPSALRDGPTDDKIDGDNQLALADDPGEQHSINTGEHPVFLPTSPGANEAQLRAILFECRAIAHPRPVPAAARGFTLAGGIVP